TPSIVQFDSATGSVALQWDAAVTDDDCGLDKPAVGIDTCTDFPGATRPTLDAYDVYRLFGACNAPPTTGLASAWNFIGSTTSTTFKDVVPANAGCVYYAIGLTSGGFSTKWLSKHTTPLSSGDCVADSDCTGNACSAGACVGGACVYTPLADGTPCP